MKLLFLTWNVGLQKMNNCIGDGAKCIVFELADFSCHQTFVGRKDFAGPGVTCAAQRTGSKVFVFDLNGSGISIRIAGQLA